MQLIALRGGAVSEADFIFDFALRSWSRPGCEGWNSYRFESNLDSKERFPWVIRRCCSPFGFKAGSWHP